MKKYVMLTLEAISMLSIIASVTWIIIGVIENTFTWWSVVILLLTTSITFLLLTISAILDIEDTYEL